MNLKSEHIKNSVYILRKIWQIYIFLWDSVFITTGKAEKHTKVSSIMYYMTFLNVKVMPARRAGTYASFIIR